MAPCIKNATPERINKRAMHPLSFKGFPRLETYCFKYLCQGAEAGECRLQEIGTNESSKPKPIWVVHQRQQQADQNKTSGKCEYQTINGHRNLLTSTSRNQKNKLITKARKETISDTKTNVKSDPNDKLPKFLTKFLTLNFDALRLFGLWPFSFFFPFVLSSFRVFVIVFQVSARKNTNYRTMELRLVQDYTWKRWPWDS